MAYVDLNTIQRPTPGSNVPVAQWGAQVNDNIAWLKANADDLPAYLERTSFYTTGHVTADGNIVAADDIGADGFIRAGVGNPLWRLQRFGGVLAGDATAAVAHNIFNGAQRVVLAGAVWKGNVGEANKVAAWTVDGTNFIVNGGTGAGSRAWRGAIIYTVDSVAW